MCPALATFHTLITPDDRFDALVEEACVRLTEHELTPGHTVATEHFLPESLAEPRSVPVRLLRPADLFDHLPEVMDDACIRARLALRGFKTLSLHAFLALLGQHRDACRLSSGTTVFDGPSVGGYACVYRFFDRPGFRRDLRLCPIRSSGGKHQAAFKAAFIWAELFAVEPIADDR